MFLPPRSAKIVKLLDNRKEMTQFARNLKETTPPAPGAVSKLKLLSSVKKSQHGLVVLTQLMELTVTMIRALIPPTVTWDLS